MDVIVVVVVTPLCNVRSEGKKKKKEKKNDDEVKCHPLSGKWLSRNHFLEGTEHRSLQGSPLNRGGHHRLSGKVLVVVVVAKSEPQANVEYVEPSEIEKGDKLLESKSQKDKIQTLSISNVKGDGNCLFCSLSLAIFKTEEKHAEIRKQIVERLKNQKKKH